MAFIGRGKDAIFAGIEVILLLSHQFVMGLWVQFCI